MEKTEKYFRVASAPEEQPLTFDLETNLLYLDKDQNDSDSVIHLDQANSVAKMQNTLNRSRPPHLKEFFSSMNDYVKATTPKAAIDPDTGELILDPKMARSALQKVCANLAWLYEAQYRQNKEILLWIGELILDYMARATSDMSVEEAIEDLGLLDRHNGGVKWKLRTLTRWPIVVQRIPPEIRQLPIPPTYLSEAAMFSQPTDPMDKIKFNNARDAILVAVSEKPELWTRERLVSCMKELQDSFGMERMRNEGVAALQERLIAYYRLQRESVGSGNPTQFFSDMGMDDKEVASWIFSIECELQNRGKMTPDPKDNVPKGDGLTAAARERGAKINAKKL